MPVTDNPLIAAHVSQAVTDAAVDFMADDDRRNAFTYGFFAGICAAQRGEPLRLNDVPADLPSESVAEIRKEYIVYLIGYFLGWCAGHWYLQYGAGIVTGIMATVLLMMSGV